MWNAYVRVWALGAYLDWLRLSRVCEDGRRDAAAFARLEGVDGSGSLCPGLSGFGALFDAASTEVERVRDEGADGDAAADRVLSLIAASPVVPPVLELADPARRHDRVLDQANMLELFRWIRSDSPDEWRRLYFGDDGTNGR